MCGGCRTRTDGGEPHRDAIHFEEWLGAAHYLERDRVCDREEKVSEFMCCGLGLEKNQYFEEKK